MRRDIPQESVGMADGLLQAGLDAGQVVGQRCELQGNGWPHTVSTVRSEA
jgi:hypothetical protein